MHGLAPHEHSYPHLWHMPSTRTRPSHGPTAAGRPARAPRQAERLSRHATTGMTLRVHAGQRRGGDAARTDPTGRLAAISRQPARPSAGPAGPAALAGSRSREATVKIPSGHGQLFETVRFCDSGRSPVAIPESASRTRVRNHVAQPALSQDSATVVRMGHLLGYARVPGLACGVVVEPPGGIEPPTPSLPFVLSPSIEEQAQVKVTGVAVAAR
jgi:hypothetical protein